MCLCEFRVCPKKGWWRSARSTATPWPWTSPTMRDRFTSTTDTSSGCGTWTGGDTWICLLAWRLSVSATATRKAPSSFAVLHNDWHVFILLWRPVLLWHRKVTAAAEKQLKRLWHTTNIYVHPTLHEYCEKLASNLPDPLKVPWWSLMKRGQERCINTRVEVKTTAGLCFPLQVIYLTNSGTEANDLAMLMARLYTGNYEIITFRYMSYLIKTWKLRHVNSNSFFKCSNVCFIFTFQRVVSWWQPANHGSHLQLLI